MAGLPGAGKSYVAARIAEATAAVVVSVDPIEAAMWHAGVGGPDRPDVPTGYAAYVVAETVAEQALRGGAGVVVDAVNAVEPARAQWRGLAARTGVPLIFVEVVCSDAATHRSRLEARRRDIPGFPEPTWDDVASRQVDAWTHERVVVDTAGDPRRVDDDVARLVCDLRTRRA
ncbi:conserved hypothetical protein [Beutenbergia cavernae DSM 12333]|uniref:Kinase n=2 Tax=Beutenbergia TaxID=84756 RepID=C5C2U8_BEUC1|nr:conserved hypothetical protein [Beutenbergia cavernae DSM 12333]